MSAPINHFNSTGLLSTMLHRLTTDYPDSQWDGSTREMFDDVAAHLGLPAFVWPDDV